MRPFDMLSEVDMMPPHTISISPTDKFIFYNTNAVESSLFCEFFCFLFYYSVSMEYMFLIICLRRLDESTYIYRNCNLMHEITRTVGVKQKFIEINEKKKN